MNPRELVCSLQQQGASPEIFKRAVEIAPLFKPKQSVAFLAALPKDFDFKKHLDFSSRLCADFSNFGADDIAGGLRIVASVLSKSCRKLPESFSPVAIFPKFSLALETGSRFMIGQHSLELLKAVSGLRTEADKLRSKTEKRKSFVFSKKAVSQQGVLTSTKSGGLPHPLVTFTDSPEFLALELKCIQVISEVVERTNFSCSSQEAVEYLAMLQAHTAKKQSIQKLIQLASDVTTLSNREMVGLLESMLRLKMISKSLTLSVMKRLYRNCEKVDELVRAVTVAQKIPGVEIQPLAEKALGHLKLELADYVALTRSLCEAGEPESSDALREIWKASLGNFAESLEGLAEISQIIKETNGEWLTK